MKEKMKTIITKVKNKVVYLGLALQLFMLTNPVVAYAKKEDTKPSTGGSLGSSAFVTGIKNLLNDASVVLLVIEAILIVVLEIMEGIKFQSAPDEEKPKHKKSMKSILGVGILIVSFTSLIPIVLGYFQ